MGVVFSSAIQGEATIVKGFDSVPGVLFLGLKFPNRKFVIGLLSTLGGILEEAHFDTITSF